MLQKLSKTCLFLFELNTKAKLLSPPNKSKWIVNQLHRLGPTYVKVGQFLSSRSDIFTKDDIDALKTLQDDVYPLDWNVINKVCQSNLDMTRFLSFDEKSIASASIGQVHRAQLVGGENVVVKVKRPNIANEFELDLQIIENVISFIGFVGGRIGKDKMDETRRIISDLRYIIQKEVDFSKEVDNMKIMALTYPDVSVPIPIFELCNNEIIVMSYVPSRKIDPLVDSKKANMLMELFVKQLLYHGLLHGDPHISNIAISSLEEENEYNIKWVFYDHGNIIRIDKKTQSLMKILIFEIMTENVDGVIDAIRKMPDIIEIKNEGGIEDYIKKYIRYVKTIDLSVFKDIKDTDMLPVKFASIIFEIVRVFGIVEGICVSLDPGFKYDTIFLKYVDTLIIDRDFLDYKIKKDLELLRTWFP